MSKKQVYIPRSRLRIPSGDSRRNTLNNKRARNWVEKNIFKKEKYVHGIVDEPTDAFGNIDFKGTTRKAKAKFARFSDATDPRIIFNLMTKYWHLEKPRLLISVAGGAKRFNLPPRLKEVFSNGLLKVAQTPGAWVITGGTNTGVMQHVGEALQGITNACIGISYWGKVTNREVLIRSDEQDRGLGGTFPYQVSSSLVKKGAYLDQNHTHHLMVDDGNTGPNGGEISFRSSFEKYVIESANSGDNTKVPAVLLVLEGGIATLDTIWSAISDESPISIVVVKGSGRAADVITHAIHFVNDSDADEKDLSARQRLLDKIGAAFPALSEESRNSYLKKVIYCLKKRESFTIFQVGGEANLDETIMTALLKGQKAKPCDQLHLTLLWDRADLAREKILSQNFSWDKCDLDSSMVIALALDRVDFVKLFLEYGICISQLLNNEILEFLYAYQSQTYSSTLCYEFDDKEYYVNANLFKEKHLTVIGLLSNFEGFNPMKCAIPRKIIQRVLSVLCQNLMIQGQRSFIEDISHDLLLRENVTFKYPYRELFFWAVLNNKHRMAIFLWEFEEEGMTKALIAAEINNMLSRHSERLDLQDDLVKSFASNAADFKELALSLLDECYRTSESKTVKLITTDFCQFPKQTSLGTAVHTNVLEYVSHSAVQGLLSEVWTGAMKRREVHDWQLMLAFVIPPYISKLVFHTPRERRNLVRSNKEDDEEEFAFIEDSSNESRDDEGIPIQILSPINHTAAGEQLNGDVIGAKARRRTFSYKDNRVEENSTHFFRKVYEFYFNTPVVKFYASLISYFGFLLLFGYVALTEKNFDIIREPEIAMITYVVSISVAELHQIAQGHGHSLNVKLREWSYSKWNLLDATAILLFFVAIGMRFFPSTAHIGHVCYGIDGAFWVIRLLKVLYVHSILGPYVVMISKMLKDTLYFLCVLIIFLLAYGISTKSVLQPQREGTGFWQLVRNLIFHPYFNIFGEFFIDRDPLNNMTTRFGTPVRNEYAETVSIILLGIYLLVTNVLLMNLLIAIFNHTFNNVQENAEQIWKFQRYGLVIEYDRASPVAPPLSLFVHVFYFIRYLFRLCGVCHTSDSNMGLRCFSSSDEKEELLEFENRCMANFMRKREAFLGKSIEEASVDILSRLDGVQATIKGLDDRFRKIEEKSLVTRSSSIWHSWR